MMLMIVMIDGRLNYSVRFGNNVTRAKILHTAVFVKLFILEFVAL